MGVHSIEKGVPMTKTRYLAIALRFFGVANLITAFTIPLFFGDLLLWRPRNLPTELMVGSLYFAMGIMMLVTARQPMRHKAFLEFTIQGNIMHAIVMAAFAEKTIQLVVDAAFIGLMGLVLLALYPWGIRAFFRHGQAEQRPARGRSF
jgi:hypothetical protein